MPYSRNNPPAVAQNWTESEQEKCIIAANAVLKDGGSEEDAIFACISAAGKSEDDKQKELEELKQLIKELKIKFNVKKNDK